MKRSLTEVQKQYSGRKGKLYFSWLDQKPNKLEGFVGIQFEFTTMSIMTAPNRVLLTDNAGNTMFFDDVDAIDVADGIVPGSKYFTIVCRLHNGAVARYFVLADYD